MVNILKGILILGLIICVFFVVSSAYFLLTGETSAGIFVVFIVVYPCVFVIILKTLLRIDRVFGEDE